MAGILKRLESIERKLDACLVFLRIITTHDDFVYSHDDKSERWLMAIAEARKIANGAGDDVVDFHRDGMWSENLHGLRVRRRPASEMGEKLSPMNAVLTQDRNDLDRQ